MVIILMVMRTAAMKMIVLEFRAYAFGFTLPLKKVEPAAYGDLILIWVWVNCRFYLRKGDSTEPVQNSCMQSTHHLCTMPSYCAPKVAIRSAVYLCDRFAGPPLHCLADALAK